MRNTLYIAAALAIFAVSASAQPITSCGTTITVPGSYYLTGNLTCPATSHGIIVEADNVTIDLKGFTLTGGGSRHGITNSVGPTPCAVVPKYLLVTNGRISNWRVGVNLCAPTGPAQLSRARIRQLTISGNAAGVVLANLIGAVVSSNVIESNNISATLNAGVHVQLGAQNSVSSNTIRFNSVAGVVIASGTEQNVYGNTILNNGANGVLVKVGAGLATIRQNQSFGHTTWDLADEATSCGTNSWTTNTYGTRSQTCIN